MAQNILIIVSGLPATGKTTLSKAIADQLQLPLFSKDEIKEILFDKVGHGDRRWGERLNGPTYAILNYAVERQLRAGKSVIVESPYDDDFPCHTYQQWQAMYGFTCIQIMCYASPAVLVERFIARIGAVGRHPGHNDEAALEDFKQSIKNAGKVDPLPLTGEVLELDTTDFTALDSAALLRQLEQKIQS